MKISERIERLKAELENCEVIEIVAPTWARTPIGQQPPAAAEAAPAVEKPPRIVVDTTKAGGLRTPRQKRSR